ncbi:MAG TPA: hypothetical protein VKR58_02950 [Aquella sp.]|nr:hypothetical protein [Aquella sp.]
MQNTIVTPVINTGIPIEKLICKYVNSPSGCTNQTQFHLDKYVHPPKNEDNLLKRIEQLENDRIADRKRIEQLENDRIADRKRIEQLENDIIFLKGLIVRDTPSIQSEPRENCSMIETQWNPQQSYQPVPIQIQSFNPEKQNYRAPRNNYVNVNPEKKPYSGPKPKKDKKEKIPNPVEHATFEKKYSPPPNGNNFNKKERVRPTLNNGWGTPAVLEDRQGWGNTNNVSDENPGW